MTDALSSAHDANSPPTRRCHNPHECDAGMSDRGTPNLPQLLDEGRRTHDTRLEEIQVS